MASLEETIVNSTPEQVGGAIRATAEAAGIGQPQGQEVFLPVVGGPGARVQQPGLGGTGPVSAPPGQQMGPAQPGAPVPMQMPGQPQQPEQPQMSEMEMQARQDAQGAQAGLGVLGKLFGWGTAGAKAAKAGQWSKHALEVEQFIKQNPHVSVAPDRLLKIKETLTQNQWDKFQDRIRVAKPNGGRTTMDDLATTYAQSLLLGVGANERNLMSNLFRIAEIFPMAFVEGVAGRTQMAFGDKTVHHIPSEGFHALFATGEATRQSLRAFARARQEVQAARQGVLPPSTKADRQFRNVFEASNSLWVQKFGHMWSKGTEGLFYADEMAKGFIREIEMERAAHRWAYFMGRDHATRAKIYAEIKKNPPDFVRSEVELQAHQGTMTQQLESTAWVNAMLERHPTMRFAVPFVTAPTNFAFQTFQRTPIMNFFSAENARMFNRGGTDRDKALARYGVGAATAWAAVQLIEGGYITGSGENYHPMYRKALQEAGWEPNSIYLGDDIGYVGTRELGPFFNGFSTLANLWEARDLLSEEDYMGAANHVVWSFGHLMTAVPFAEATGRLFDAIYTRDKAVQKIAREVGNMASNTAIPAFLQEASRASASGRMMHGPAGGDTDVPQVMKELEELWKETSRKLPWNQDDTELDRGPFGDVILNYNPYMPVRRSAVNARKRDVVLKLGEVVPMGMFAITSYVGASGTTAPSGQPGLERAVGGYTYTKAEKSKMLQLRGEARLDGKNFFEAVEEYVNSPEWEQTPGTGADSERAKRVRSIVKRYTKEAERQFNDERVQQGQPTTKEQKKDYKERKKARGRGEE